MGETAGFTMTPAQAAAALGVSDSTLRRWASEGRLPHIVTPGKWRRFRPEDVDAFARSLMVEAAPEPDAVRRDGAA